MVEYRGPGDGGIGTNYRVSSVSVVDGKWHHVTVINTTNTTVIGGNDINIYIDGILSQGSLTNNGVYYVSANAIRSGFGGSGYFNGSLDDIRVYSRALSAQEIKQLYNAGAGSKVNASQQTNTTTSLKTGLVGHWTFDSKDLKTNVADTSGLGNNGYMQGFGATSSAVTVGKLGQGLKFDGVNDYINLANTIPITGASPRTVTAWIRREANVCTGSWKCPIIEFGASGTGARNTLYLKSNKLSFIGFSADLDGSLDVPLNKWTFVAEVYDGTNMTFYVNNSVSTPAPLTLNTGSSFATIGHDTLPNNFPGSIDDVRIYSRALSASEIKQLYNAGAGSKVNASQQTDTTTSLKTGLVGHWTFDSKDLKTNVADTSGLGNNGSLMGFGATSSAVTAGKMGQGLKFDGVNDVVTGVGNAGSYSFTTGDFSIGAWVKTNQSKTVLTFSRGDNAYGRYAVFSDRAVVYTGSVYITASSATAIDNKFHYVTGVFNRSTSSISFYVDGVVKDSVYWDGTMQNVGGNFVSIGATYRINSVDYASLLKGSLDDVRIYSRALSAAEVKQLYNMGR